MFSRSYAPSFVLEEAAKSGSPVKLPSARTPPAALAAPAIIQDLFADPATVALATVAEEARQDEQQADDQSANAVIPEKRKARISTIGRALFPPSADLSINKRLSLPAGPAKKASAIPKLRRKSLSPTSAANRASTLHAASSGSLLALPLAAQLHTLKARNASLESSLAAVNSNQSNGLFKATQRIASLEKELADKASLKLECEGWEAEAIRLATELDAQQEQVTQASEDVRRAEQALQAEKDKKKRYKDLGAKLRCELLNRKWKEKWELCMMDAADRDKEVNEIKLEAEVAELKFQLGLARLDKEEFEELNSHQASRISELTASRELLLGSLKTAEATITTLRSELSVAHQDTTKETSTLKKELATSKSTPKSVQLELASAKERAIELEAEVERLGEVEKEAEEAKNELTKLEKGGRSEAKEAGEVRKALEKEKAKREKAEADAKDLKASLKQSQVELREANKAAALAVKDLAKAKASLATSTKTSKPVVALPSVAVLASRKRRSLTHDGSDPVPAFEVEDEPDVTVENDEEEEEDNEVEEEDDDSSLEDLKAAAKARVKKEKAAAVPKAVPRPPSPPVSISEDEEEEESYRPPVAVVRAASKPKAAPKASKAVLADAEATGSETDVPASAPVKKRKAGVLTDKPANATKKPKVVKAKAEKSLGGEGMKKKGAVAEEDAVEEKEEPAKKKKRILFGGPKKFTWGSIENADVNSLGLPSHLSPIKAPAAARPTMGGLGSRLGAGIFG